MKIQATQIRAGMRIKVPGVRRYHKVISVHRRAASVDVVFDPPWSDLLDDGTMAFPRTVPDEIVKFRLTDAVVVHSRSIKNVRGDDGIVRGLGKGN